MHIHVVDQTTAAKDRANLSPKLLNLCYPQVAQALATHPYVAADDDVPSRHPGKSQHAGKTKNETQEQGLAASRWPGDHDRLTLGYLHADTVEELAPPERQTYVLKKYG